MKSFKQYFIHFIKNKGMYEKFLFYVSIFHLNVIKEPNPLYMFPYLVTGEEQTYWKKNYTEWTEYINKKIYISALIFKEKSFKNFL